jgi:hypothetical protein
MIAGWIKDAQELAHAVIFRVMNHASRAAYPRSPESLIANISCVSCHKMNALRFDSHSFGYLEDRDLTISPGVVRDMESDLQ